MTKVHTVVAQIDELTDLPAAINIIDASIKAINLEGSEVIAFDAQRKFVPSFDKSKADTTLIASWTSKDEDDPEDRISVIGELDLAAGTVFFKGTGFKSVEIEVIEKLPIPENALAVDEKESLEDLEEA